MNILWSAIIAGLAFGLIELIARNKISPRAKHIISVAIFLVAVNLTKNIPNPLLSHYDQKIQEYGNKLAKMPVYKAKVLSTNDATKIMAQTNQLIADGLQRLDDDSLVERLKINGKLLNLTDDKSCASISKGTTDSTTIVSDLVKKLDNDSFDKWLDINYRAIEASLQFKPAQRVTEDEVAKAYSALGDKIPTSIDRLSSILQNYDSSSDQDICWGERLLQEKALQLDDNNRNIFARYSFQTDQPLPDTRPPLSSFFQE